MVKWVGIENMVALGGDCEHGGVGWGLSANLCKVMGLIGALDWCMNFILPTIDYEARATLCVLLHCSECYNTTSSNLCSFQSYEVYANKYELESPVEYAHIVKQEQCVCCTSALCLKAVLHRINPSPVGWSEYGGVGVS